MKPLPPPEVPGDSDAARMDAAVKMLFRASKQDYQKQEEKKHERKKRAKKPLSKRISGALIANRII